MTNAVSSVMIREPRKTYSMSKAKLDRPPLPEVQKQFIGPTRYSPNKAFVARKNRSISVNKEERFDSPAYKSKVRNEQVGPHTYAVHTFDSLGRKDRNPQHYRGRFPRETSERLSSRLFIANKDTTPSPFDTDTRFGTHYKNGPEDPRKTTMRINELFTTYLAYKTFFPIGSFRNGIYRCYWECKSQLT